MINNFMTLEPQQLEPFYIDAFLYFDKNIKIPNISVEYYPYVNVNSRIKSSDGTVYIRIATLLKNAPAEVHKALSYILVAKLLGKKIPSIARTVYRDYLDDEDFQNKAVEHKRTKGRKLLTSPQGNVYDLNEIFNKLNLKYFSNEIEKPTLSWSQRRTYRRLGHYDSIHDAIIISKTLDEKSVPTYVVKYVVFHEMLHIKHPVTTRNGRRCVHTPIFKRDEEKFAYFDKAEKWITENALKIKRKVKRKR